MGIFSSLKNMSAHNRHNSLQLQLNLDVLSKQYAESERMLNAINKSQAVIEFNLDGIVLSANDNFLNVLEYKLEDIVGKHHSMFVDPAYRASKEYSEFWNKLKRGQFDSGEFKRIGRNGKEVWINATYNPVFNSEGVVCKVVKFATDVTVRKMRDADTAGQLAALNTVQAIIEFNLDGTVITANDNFLAVIGYSLNEIRGKHHSMFVDPEYRASREYSEFWARLNRGEFDAQEYKRIARGGKEIWIRASYNPIFNADGKVYKVVKFATDITAQKLIN